MQWLQGFHKKSSLLLQGERLYMRPPKKKDWEIWYYVRQRSRNYLTPWEATWNDSHMTENYFHRWVVAQQKKRKQDRSYYHFIFLKETDELMGALNIIHVLRGIAQSAALGYWIGQEFSGNGFMTEAMRLALPYGFHDLQLHRFQAAIINGNHASKALVEKFGFREEGEAQRFLHVNGKWRDHKIYALTKEEWQGEVLSRTRDTGKFLRIDT